MIRLCVFAMSVAIVFGELAKLHLSPNPIDDQYIIAPEHNVATDKVKDYLLELASQNDDMNITVLWTLPTGLKFILVKLNERGLQLTREYEGITYIEQDGWVKVQGDKSSEGGSPKTDEHIDQWGLDRIDQRDLPRDGVYSVKTDGGSGVNIYVVGTGVNAAHKDFEGRAKQIYDYRGEDEDGWDCNGHGTHMASIAAGKTYGVAKAAKIYGVRVTRCIGIGKMSDVVKGLDWLSSKTERRCVTVMGVSSPVTSPSIDNALYKVYSSGCAVVVPSGNNISEACDFSPARMDMVLTVAATSRMDYAAHFSNQGKCVDLFAPGVSIKAAYYGSNTATEEMSGTSMASAHAAGAAAVHMGNGMMLSKVEAYMKRHASKDKLHEVKDNTPNKLLYLKGKLKSPSVNETKDSTPAGNDTTSKQNVKSEL